MTITAQQLKYIRTGSKLPLTQEQAAEIIGVDVRTYQHYEDPNSTTNIPRNRVRELVAEITKRSLLEDPMFDKLIEEIAKESD